MEEVNAENWEEKYYEVLENNGGIVYVKADGTYDYYADYDAFAAQSRSWWRITWSPISART